MHGWGVVNTHLKKPMMQSSERKCKGYLQASSSWIRFQRILQSSMLRASFPAMVFHAGRALLSFFSSRSLAISSWVQARGAARTDDERHLEMFRASAALSRWLYL